MKGLVILFLTMVLACSEVWAGEMRAVYQPATPQYFDIYNWMAGNDLLGQYANIVDKMFKLPVQVPIVGQQCNMVNAFYDPNKKMVIVCYEMAESIINAFSDITDQQQRDMAVRGTLTYIVFHEFGHMLINLFDLPAVGREEDSVDQMSALVLLKGGMLGETTVIYSGAFWKKFRPLTNALSNMSGSRDYADVHGLDEQRTYNLWCYAYGHDPSGLQSLVQQGGLPGGLPQQRAQGCQYEYQKADRAWGKLLAPYFEPGVKW